MIYEQNCYNLNVKYFDNLIEINIKNIANKFIRFKIYENILNFFKLYKCNMNIQHTVAAHIFSTNNTNY